MKNLSPKFYLSFGLTSMLFSIVLFALFSGLIPDRRVIDQQSRSVFAESVASSSSLFLQSNDFSSIRSNLQFVVSRHRDLLSAAVKRNSDGSEVVIGEVADVITDLPSGSIMTVPVLANNGEEWGAVTLVFKPLNGAGWIEYLQRSRLFLVFFVLLTAFVAFYFYLGKMLKQLNPSSAVPARVRSALDTIAESLIVINRKGDIVLANSAFSNLAGRPPEQMIGMSVDALPWELKAAEEEAEGNDTYKPDDGVFRQPWKRALEMDQASRNDMIWFTDSRGVRHKFIVNCSPVAGASGKAGGVLISLDDVTLLEEKERELLRSREEAVAANHAKSDFLSNMSHEIRTPMTAILGFTEVLKRGYNRDEASAQKYLDTISRSGKHLLNLINDILDLSKVESGSLVVERIECEAHTVISDVIQVLAVKAEEKSIYLRQEFPEALPEFIYSDPARLRQIVTNLIGNAIKFTESGGVTVSCRVLGQGERQQLSIEVTDTGIGMTPQQAESIFDAFVQADSTITRKFGGTGLGLSISRDLSHALGGDITVSSIEGQGSTFRVTLATGDTSQLKLLSPTQLMQDRKIDAQHSLRGFRFVQTRVLVVDDAQENLDLLCLILGELNISVDTANNGQRALEQVFKGDYDLTLMDIQMPVMDGYQAVEAMRLRGLSTPVVALTANAMKGIEEEVKRSGFSHYMTKPIDMDKLAQLLASLLPHKIASVQSQDIEQPDQTTAARGDAMGVTAQGATIHNKLVGSNPRFRKIAEDFLLRLKERMVEFHQALDNRDMENLASMAHWLKGSGGSVGFPAFSDPAAALEEAAKADDTAEAGRLLKLIDSILQRCSVEPVIAHECQTIHNLPESTGSTRETEIAADSMIMSTLPTSVPKFTEIVSRFVPTLKQRVAQMNNLLETGQFTELAAEAHWLKGSAGSVGFPDFVTPASNLETAAKSADQAAMEKNLTQILALAKRVVTSDTQGAGDDPSNSASPYRRSA